MIVVCTFCGVEFNKFPSQIKKSSNNFCCRSCAATFNNKLYPKKTKTSKVSQRKVFKQINCLFPKCNKLFIPRTIRQKYCSYNCSNNHHHKLFILRSKKHCRCGTMINFDSVMCRKCWKIEKSPWNFRTIDQQKQILSKNGKSRLNFHVTIRDSARQSYLKANSRCYNCGYSKFLEVCHIKPVSSFSGDTLISEVNSPSNLVALCRNCHWELDHGALVLI